MAATLVLAAGLLHPTTALWFAIWIAAATFVNEPRRRIPLLAAAGAAAVAAGWMLLAGPLAGRLVIMDAAWLATLETKDYLFPMAWPAYAWVLNLAYAPIIWLVEVFHRSEIYLVVLLVFGSWFGIYCLFWVSKRLSNSSLVGFASPSTSFNT